MEHYEKGATETVEEPVIFTDLDQNVVFMKVGHGSKIRNLMGFVVKKMKEPSTKQVVWNGSGHAVAKAISCAEIMKRKYKGLHQVTRIHFRRMEDYWEPKMEGLERLKVNKDVPAISILLSRIPVDSTQPGYQAPDTVGTLWKKDEQKGTKRDDKKLKKSSKEKSQFDPPSMARRERKKIDTSSVSEKGRPRKIGGTKSESIQGEAAAKSRDKTDSNESSKDAISQENEDEEDDNDQEKDSSSAVSMV